MPWLSIIWSLFSVLSKNFYPGYKILENPIILNGHNLSLIGSYLILLQLSKIRGYIILLLSLFFFIYSFPSLPFLGLNIILFTIQLFNRGYVVSSGMWFIFIMSYGIYSVTVILSLCSSSRQGVWFLYCTTVRFTIFWVRAYARVFFSLVCYFLSH